MSDFIVAIVVASFSLGWVLCLVSLNYLSGRGLMATHDCWKEKELEAGDD